MQRALVTGATGAIGPALVNRLARDGWLVRILAHRSQPENSSPGVEVVSGDLLDGASLRAAVRDVDVVFHLAALLHRNDPPPEMRADYWRTNVEGTRNLVNAARDAGVARFVFLSTINVYGPSRPEQVWDESSALRPQSWYAQTKAEAEGLVLSALPAVVLRAAAVYGLGLKGNYARLLNALRSRRFVMVGDGSNRRTLVHVADLCEAVLLAAIHLDATGQIYNVSDGRIHTLREIIAAMCSALGHAPPRFYIPAAPARLALGIVEDAMRLAGKTSPVRRSLLDKFTEHMAVSAAKLQEQLDYRPQYDLASGWQNVIRQ